MHILRCAIEAICHPIGDIALQLDYVVTDKLQEESELTAISCKYLTRLVQLLKPPVLLQ